MEADELRYALRARLGLLATSLVVFPGLAILAATAEDPGTLMHDRMTAAPYVVGIPIILLAAYRVVRPPRVALVGSSIRGSVPSVARFCWNLDEVHRFSFGRRRSVGYLERSLPREANGKGLKRIYLEDESLAKIEAALRTRGWAPRRET